MNEPHVPASDAGIKKLAQKVHKQRNRVYTSGDPSEKVWDNYQLTKELKKQFKDLCREKGVNASSYLRACVKLFIKHKGDIKKALSAATPETEATLEGSEKS